MNYYIVDASVCNTIERRIRSFLILVHSNDFTAFHTSFWIYRVTMRERERVIAVLKRSNFIGKRIAGKRWWENKKWERTAMHGRGSGDLLGVGVRASIKKMPNGFPIRIQIARNGGATGVQRGWKMEMFFVLSAARDDENDIYLPFSLHFFFNEISTRFQCRKLNGTNGYPFLKKSIRFLPPTNCDL